MTFYGQWNPPQDEVIYRNYFFNDEKGTSIECGASSGGTSTHFFADKGWKCIFIEPSKYAFTNLLSYLKGDNLLFYNLALSNKTGIATFKDIISAPGGGNDNASLQHTDKHMQELLGYGCKFEEYGVITFTYAELIKEPVDLFVLDVEGFELQVIDGMKDSEFLPKVVCVEYPITGFGNIFISMIALGYNFNFVSHNNAFFSFIEKDSWFGETERMEDL